MKLADYKVIIPLGGQGKRLKPFTKNRSKGLVPIFNNVPITEINIFNLARDLGLRNFILGVNGYQNYLDIQLYYQGGYGWSSKMGITPQVHFHYQNPNYEDLGAADSVLYNIKKFDIKKPIIVFQNDNIFSPSDIKLLWQFSLSSNFDFIIGLSRVDNPAEYGLVEFNNKTGRVTSFLEKPKTTNKGKSLINTGVYLIKPEVFDLLNIDFGNITIPKLIKQRRVGGLIFKKPWLDFGSSNLHQSSFQTILNNNFEYLLPFLHRTSKRIKNTNVWVRGRGPQSLELNINITNAILRKKVAVKGRVLIGRDCMMGENVYLESCSVGDMATINGGTKIIKSNIMDACQIGQGVEIEKSTLGRCVSVADYSKIKNSFLGDNVLVSSGKTVENKMVLKGQKI